MNNRGIVTLSASMLNAAGGIQGTRTESPAKSAPAGQPGNSPRSHRAHRGSDGSQRICRSWFDCAGALQRLRGELLPTACQRDAISREIRVSSRRRGHDHRPDGGPPHPCRLRPFRSRFPSPPALSPGTPIRPAIADLSSRRKPGRRERSPTRVIKTHVSAFQCHLEISQIKGP
jgi:hypothetical protein